MKNILILFIAVTALLPLGVYADEISPEEAWASLYEFPLEWRSGQVSQAGPYQITSGDVPAIPSGAWSLSIFSEDGQLLHRYPFDPASMAAGGDTFSLIVPIESRGALVVVREGTKPIGFSIDVRESRVCNDDAVCAADAGEGLKNCPTDCGSVSMQGGAPRTQTARIVDQVSIGERAGQALLRLSSAAAGLLLLVGVARMLDSRRRP